jgi:hypothetical protein
MDPLSSFVDNGKNIVVNPVLIEVIAPMPTDFRHCAGCETIFHETPVGPIVHQQIMDDYPDEWREDFEQLSAWISELSRKYGESLKIKLIDPYSVEGFFKSVRFMVRRYPAFILASRDKYIGWDQTALEHLINAKIDSERIGGRSKERLS